jgi:hypothetical protein
MIDRHLFSAARTTAPRTGNQTSLGTFTSYDDAQRVVDTLAERSFEVETTQIIGTNLRMVEQVTGRQTWPKAILTGMVQGVWFGLFIGLVLSILSDTSFLGAIAWGISWGVVFWGAFAALDYAWARGRRDFTSLSVTVPTTFEVLVESDHADRARRSLAAAV